MENRRSEDPNDGKDMFDAGANATDNIETRNITEKAKKVLEPNSPRAENPSPDSIEEKDLPPFQAGKPVV